MDGHDERIARLLTDLARLPDLVVAFSGGVDSSVLLHAAHAMLGPRAVGLIGDSPSLPRRELAEALEVARLIGARVERLSTDELENETYRANSGERCYACRHALFEAMAGWACAHGFHCLAYGEITDDLLDHRPGRRAASELAVLAPLCGAGLGKDDVRRYAREQRLPVAEKPASACLASRLPPGTRVTHERLERIERAEESLRDLGFGVLRVRDHGSKARVEVSAHELGRAAALGTELGRRLAPLGFLELELAAYHRPAHEMRVPPAKSASE